MMVSINYAFKEIISKIVYYGPGLSGKTTNLQHVFKKVPKDTRGELISLATDADRTLYFDFLPVNVGNIRGFQVKFQLYTVPGQVYYNATRKLVLRGVDGLVFVADSQVDKMDENIESLKNLEENLTEYGYDLNEIPFVIQYNKRDLPNIVTIEELQAQLNHRDVPYFEAVATNGAGVFATLKAISKIVIDKAQKSSIERTDSKTAVVPAVDTSVKDASKPKPRSELQTVSAKAGASGLPREDATEHSAKSKPSMAESPGQEIVASESQRAYGELDDEVISSDINIDSDNDTTAQVAKSIDHPSIVKESETMTNVVVSSDPAVGDEEDVREGSVKEDIEETTEHAILKDETNGINGIEEQKQTTKRRHHPDVLDADKLDYLERRIPEHKEPEMPEQEFTDDETVITDPRQTGQSFTKPQMAESVKVKGKRKAGLFGWLKKKQ
jgi:signal recognition particle receptor subunit beta